MRRLRPFTLVLWLATLLVLTFLLVPVLALFLRIPLGELVGQLDNEVVVDALVVTAKTNAIAFGLTILVGTPAAYLLGRRRFPGRDLVLTAIELPLVLPPAVAGIGLLAAFGRFGLLGESFEAAGISIGFTQTAVVLAILFVAGPFYLRQAIAVLRGPGRRPHPRRPHAGRRAGAGVLARRAAALHGRSRRRGGALARPGDRRVRRHHHVRRQPPGGHPDGDPGHLR